MTFQETIDKIFQGYDVRGYYPEQYNGDIAYRLGRAAVAYTGAKRVIVGRDMRRGGHALLSALLMGVMDQGADATDGGMCSSDALYHAGFKGQYDLSLMVTASHNPAAYNGTKLVRLDGTSIGSGSGLAEVKAMVMANDFPRPRRRGSLDRTDKVMPQFITHALSFINRRKLKPLKIVVDAGNGMGGMLINLLKKRVPFEFIPMYFEPDGSFPNHEADPTRPECVEILRRRVKKEKADLGLGFDGDADRSALIDEKGGLINGSELGSVIARKLLKKEPGAATGLQLDHSRHHHRVRRQAGDYAGGRGEHPPDDDEAQHRAGHRAVRAFLYARQQPRGLRPDRCSDFPGATVRVGRLALRADQTL